MIGPIEYNSPLMLLNEESVQLKCGHYRWLPSLLLKFHQTCRQMNKFKYNLLFCHAHQGNNDIWHLQGLPGAQGSVGPPGVGLVRTICLYKNNTYYQSYLKNNIQITFLKYIKQDHVLFCLHLIAW